MSGQKGKSGGARENAGRKSKAEELGLPALIEDVIGEEGKKELIQLLHEKSKTSFADRQLLLAYIYGKPTEKHEVEANIIGKQIFEIAGQKIEF